MNVLWIENLKDACYGSNMLFDGLVRNLSIEQVIDFPYKPQLHGEQSWEWMPNRPGISYTEPEIVALIEDGFFDCVMVATCRTGCLEVFESLNERCTLPPIFLGDHDDGGNINTDIIEKINPIAVFKREYRTHTEYPKNFFPCPFSCFLYDVEPLDKHYNAYVSIAPNSENRARIIGELLYLFHDIRITWNDHYSYSEYLTKLNRAKIGISITSSGQDTVRYWEILGCHDIMLASDVPQIRIPHPLVSHLHYAPYKEGTALKTIKYYIDHEERRKQIAIEGRKHTRKYHTTQARALYVIDIMKEML